MEHLQDLLAKLADDRHRAGLQWYIDHAGTEQHWPNPLPDGTLLVTRAKGIYKPAWMEYALSVRQVLGGPYADRDPVRREDGTWVYAYFQENSKPQERDSEYTNCGLLACMRDGVPVGVMRQVQSKPTTRYRVLGLALVAGWEDGYFFLEGFSPQGLSHGPGPDAEIAALGSELRDGDGVERFVPANVRDGRRRILAAIVQRQGQAAFRQQLLQAYEGRCCITGCEVPEVLEAAHIMPYRGPDTNHPCNGFLLRADLHTLFDIGLLMIDTTTMTARISRRLAGTEYAELAGQPIWLPREAEQRPSKDAPDAHRRWAELGIADIAIKDI